MMKRRSTTFYCFSPPVMIATCAIELGLLIYTVWRYKLNEITRLVCLILAGLATFQLAEFFVCQSSGTSIIWSRVGYVAITLLPPFVLHLVYALAHARRRLLLWLAYASSLAFVVIFAFVSHSITGNECLGNYVIFQIDAGANAFYGAYYYGWLFVGAVLSAYFIRVAGEPKTKRALAWLGAGYTAFIVPTIAVTLANPETIKGIPSIMCGFAVILALALGFWVLPQAGERKS